MSCEQHLAIYRLKLCNRSHINLNGWPFMFTAVVPSLWQFVRFQEEFSCSWVGVSSYLRWHAIQPAKNKHTHSLAPLKCHCKQPTAISHKLAAPDKQPADSCVRHEDFSTFVSVHCVADFSPRVLLPLWAHLSCPQTQQALTQHVVIVCCCYISLAFNHCTHQTHFWRFPRSSVDSKAWQTPSCCAHKASITWASGILRGATGESCRVRHR